MIAGAKPELVATGPQRLASDPQVSAWVSASAGSGKTHVLVNRVIRLLLAGTSPDHIICITFTKAAAAQMAGRLYDRLARWTGLNDAELDQSIAAICGAGPNREQRLVARRLFARALETPGGLKIQTIHAFCESLLHRFPLEAQIYTEFEVLDDASAAELRQQAIHEVLRLAQGGAAPEIARALPGVVRHLQDVTFEDVIAKCLQNRDLLKSGEAGDAVDWRRALAVVFGKNEGFSPDRVIAEALTINDLHAARLREWAGVLKNGSKTDKAQGERVEKLLRPGDPVARYEAYLTIHLTSTMFNPGRHQKKDLMTKALREAHRDLAEWAVVQQQRATESYDDYKIAHAIAASSDLLVVVTAILDVYKNLKQARAVLDYDDLIERTRFLLLRSDATPWVLYKLDGGIDHVLVDEAQDTSAGQWEIIGRLVDDFFSGEAARDINRTLFAVGDEKQSIFSFQGADPALFAANRRAFGKMVTQAGETFEPVPLTVSYRSTRAVLAAVDKVFARPDAAAGLVADGDVDPHQPWRSGQPGLVEIWPVIEHEDDARDDPWQAASDYRNPMIPEVALAEKIAATIEGWISHGTELEARGRVIRPGDILILLRKRTRFMHPMVRALKRRDIAVAGADRMTLSQQMAVMDLIALGRVALLPEDDLSLAEVLKSPLIGFDDDQLFAIAHGREDTLWRALQAAAGKGAPYAQAHERLHRWLAMADQMPVFEFFARILDADGMRQHMLARLGAQANDPIDEFLTRTLHYERTATASLQGFLGWFAAGETEIKRDTEQDRNEVRVMTTHGAKGLEANIVFLPDTCGQPVTRVDAPFILARRAGARPGEEVPVWHINKGMMPDQMAPTIAALDTAREEESHRLLYVAMTRARDRLYICGYGTRNKRPDGCWYNLMHDALASPENAITSADGEIVCWREADAGDGRKMPEEPPPDAGAELVDLPGWAVSPASAELPPERRLAPSRLGAEAGEDDTPPALSPLQPGNENRFRRGRLIHLLLQFLPELPAHQRAARALSFLALPGNGLSEPEQHAMVREVLAVLDDERFAPFFSPQSRAEVSLIAKVPVNGETVTISGQIDRLAVGAETVHIIDYKTNRPAPGDIAAVPVIYVRQMAAYATALGQLYPGKAITCALLWTDGPQLMVLPPDLLKEYEVDVSSDGGRAGSNT